MYDTANLALISPQGEKLWGEEGVTVSTSSQAVVGVVANVTPSGTVVTWMDENDSTLHYQKVDDAGTLMWGSGGLIYEPSALLPRSATIGAYTTTTTSDGATMIAFATYEGGSGLGAGDTYLMRVEPDGTSTWGAHPIRINTDGTTTVPMNTTIALAADDAGGVVLAWEQVIGNGTVAMMQRINQDGTAVFADPVVSVAPEFGGEQPEGMILQFASDSQETTILTSMNGTGARVVTNRVSATGDLLWGDGVVLQDNGESNTSALLPLGDDLVAAWVTPTNEIVAQRLTPAGDLVWDEPAVLTSRTDMKLDLQGAVDTAGTQFVYLWDNDGETIAQNLNLDGTLG